MVCMGLHVSAPGPQCIFKKKIGVTLNEEFMFYFWVFWIFFFFAKLNSAWLKKEYTIYIFFKGKGEKRLIQNLK